jgi:hypothetical protein
MSHRSLFTDPSRLDIFEGLGIRPAGYDPLTDAVQADQLRDLLAALARSTAAGTAAARPHNSYFQ